MRTTTKSRRLSAWINPKRAEFNSELAARMQELGFEAPKQLHSLAQSKGFAATGPDIVGLLNGSLLARDRCGEWHPTALVVADLLDCSPESIFDFEHQWGPDSELGEPAEEQGCVDSYWQWAVTPVEQPDEVLEKKNLSRLVSETLLTLSAREERIVRLYFGIGVDRMTFRAIALSLGLSRSRVEQILSSTIQRLVASGVARRLSWSVSGDLDQENIGRIEAQEREQKQAELSAEAEARAKEEAFAKLLADAKVAAIARAKAQAKSDALVQAKLKAYLKAESKKQSKVHRASEEKLKSALAMRDGYNADDLVKFERVHIFAYVGFLSGRIPWPNLENYGCRMWFVFSPEIGSALVIKADQVNLGRYLSSVLRTLGFDQCPNGNWINRETTFSVDEFVCRLPDAVRTAVDLADVTVDAKVTNDGVEIAGR